MSRKILVPLLVIALQGLASAWGEEPASRADSLFERVRAGDPEAVAIYERRFEEAEDVDKKKSVAMFLAAAGRASEVHMRYLESFAWEAVQSTRPFPFAYDEEGNAIVDPPVFTEEFKAWVEGVAGDLEEEARIAMWEQPSEIISLKSVENPRADEILLAGLRTPNLMVRITSLNVLVDHRHADLLPAMLEAIREMPAELHQVLGLELLRLLDERADEAARELIGDDELYRQLRDDLRARAAAPRQDDRRAEEDVNPNAPRLTAHPGSSTTVAGQEVRFSCAVEGNEPVSFSWRRDGEPVVDGRRVSGAETATLTLYAVEASDNGSYRCVARNEAGETMSGPGILKVVAPQPR